LLTHMDNFMRTLPNRRKQYNCGVLRSKIVNCVIENECVVRDAHMDKACYLSTFVYVLLSMINKFGLSLEQVLEIVIPMGWVTEPYKLCSTLIQWVKSAELPDGNLTVALVKEIGENMRGFGSGPRSRHQIKCSKPFRAEVMYNGLRLLRHVVLHCNAIPAPLTSATKILELYKKCIKDLRGVFNFGSMGSQHVLAILSMCRVIKHVGLATVAMVGKDTGSFKTVTKQFGIHPAQLDGLIKTVALHFHCNRAVAENLICESLRKSKAYDFQFRGQSLYHPVAQPPNVHEVVEIRSNGSKVVVPEFAFNVPIIKRNFVNWWSARRTKDISSKHRQLWLYPTTSSGQTPTTSPGSREVVDHICSEVVSVPTKRKAFRNDPQQNLRLKQDSTVHGLCDKREDIEANLVNIIKDKTGRNIVPIPAMEYIPKLLFSKALIEEKGYTMKDNEIKMDSKKVAAIQQGYFATLLVGNKEYDYSTQCGNWKPTKFSIGDYSCEDGVIRYLYSRANHSHRCVLLGHLAFGNAPLSRDAVSARKKLFKHLEVSNNIYLDVHDSQSKQRMFVLYRNGDTVRICFPMPIYTENKNVSEYRFHIIDFGKLSK
jgi:hypothetical protein